MSLTSEQKEHWLNIISARAQYISEKIAQNSEELFKWRNKILKIHNINSETGEFDETIAPFIILDSKAQKYILAICLLNKYSYSQSLEFAQEAIDYANNLLKKITEQNNTLKNLNISSDSNNQELTLKSDGASRGNPGQASAGWAIYSNNQLIHTNSQTLGVQTNNYAEYQGVILGITDILNNYKNCEILKIQIDSDLIVKQVQKKYKVKDANLKILYSQLEELLIKLKDSGCNWSIEHIRREYNKDADRMCNEALDNL